MKSKSIKIDFVMPAYNEEENIENVVSEWHKIIEELNNQGHCASLIIANDGSKDATWDKMDDLKNYYSNFIPLNKQNSGHGATLLFLYQHSITRNVDYIFQTDSDGQTEPTEFWKMWEKHDKYDFQIGHRIKREDGFSRIIVTKTLKGIVKSIFGVTVKDANTPFRLMNVNKLKETLKFIPKDFFLSNVAISAIAVRKNFEINWIPITFKPRQGGVNSINIKRIVKIGFKAIGDLKMINKNLKYENNKIYQ